MSTYSDIKSDGGMDPRNHLTEQQAYDMGAKGAEPTEEERKLFEAWMAGHCWEVEGGWDGRTYVHSTEINLRQVHFGAMRTRQLWAAWRDRAALAAQPQPVLQDIEQYRLQMAGISTAALGYWKEGDSIHPDYDTLALRDVAKLYANYAALCNAAPAAQQCKWPTCQSEEHQQALAEQIKQELVTGTAQPEWVPVTQELLNAQHPWLYKDMWIAMKDGGLMTGHYKWMQGRYPDRFVIGSNTHVWAFEATHVMPMNQPKHPNKESS